MLKRCLHHKNKTKNKKGVYTTKTKQKIKKVFTPQNKNKKQKRCLHHKTKQKSFKALTIIG
jgi:hypothetical protein